MILHVTDVLPKSPWVGEEALLRGRHVHLACHHHDLGVLEIDSVHEPWRGYVRAWIECKEREGIEVISSEEQVVSSLHGFVGTLDNRARIRGNRGAQFIIDRKNGGAPPHTGRQIGAYALAAREMGLLGSDTAVRAVVVLKPDGTYDFTTELMPRQKIFRGYDEQAFLAYLTIAKIEIAEGLRPMPEPRKED